MLGALAKQNDLWDFRNDPDSEKATAQLPTLRAVYRSDVSGATPFEIHGRDGRTLGGGALICGLRGSRSDRHPQDLVPVRGALHQRVLPLSDRRRRRRGALPEKTKRSQLRTPPADSHRNSSGCSGKATLPRDPAECKRTAPWSGSLGVEEVSARTARRPDMTAGGFPPCYGSPIKDRGIEIGTAVCHVRFPHTQSRQIGPVSRRTVPVSGLRRKTAGSASSPQIRHPCSSSPENPA